MAIAFGCGNSKSEIKSMTPEAFNEAAKADPTAVILDVRTPDEYAQGHLDGARNLDWLNQPAFQAGMENLSPENTYYVYCRSGRRSHEAADSMQARGLKVVDMDGGILAWEKAGLPVATTPQLPDTTPQPGKVIIYGMATCPDCAYVDEQAKDDPRYVIVDIGTNVKLMKAFIRLRDNTPAVFDPVRARGSIGIPCFVLGDGTVTIVPEEAGLKSRPEEIVTGAACNIDGSGC